MAVETSKTAAEKLQEQILTLQLAKLQREESQREADEQLAKNARLIGVTAMLQERENELAAQNQCPHLKPNGQSALGGQRDHRNHYHFICGLCAKEWKDSEVPLFLRIDMSRIGGPEVTYSGSPNVNHNLI